MFSFNFLVFYSCTACMIFACFWFYFDKYNYLLNVAEYNQSIYSYGNELCDDFLNKHITLSNNIHQFISTKNVYYADYKNQSVVLKKFDVHVIPPRKHITKNDILDNLNSNFLSRDFKFCNRDTSEIFLEDVERLNLTLTRNNIWTIVNINMEPLLLRIFTKELNWPVPKLYGACGKLIVVENTGKMLHYYKNFNWTDRAYIALQLMEAAVNFTFNHPIYRYYLNDVSADNVVVDEETLKVSFVDLQHGILQLKSKERKIHHAPHNPDEYSFSATSICSNTISDHNIYFFNRVFLSKNPLGPMMKNGLLHKAPISIIVKYKQLFSSIKRCTLLKQRFYFAKLIINNLKDILHVYNYKYVKNSKQTYFVHNLLFN